jgi:hypothetical protein
VALQPQSDFLPSVVVVVEQAAPSPLGAASRMVGDRRAGWFIERPDFQTHCY